MIELERKYCGPGGGLAVSDGATVEGFASVFGAADQGGDVVAPGAFTAALSDAGRKVRMLWQHDPAQPIGVWDEVVETETGLWVRGRFVTGAPRGAEAAALVEAGAIDGLSIGYRVKRAEKDREGRRVLRQLELWEVSLVTFPMLTEARVASKARGDDGDALGALAAGLRAAGRELSVGRSAAGERV